MNRVSPLAVTVCLGALSFASAAAADEGMWTYENFPSAKVQATYGVKIDKPWLDHMRAASVRLPGCSASVVSKDGLVLTNNHCVVDCLVELSSPEKDHMKDGFLTATRAEERQCPGMTAEILVGTFDVTDQIRAATDGKTGQDYATARSAAIAAAEQANCKGEAGFRCQTIPLYRGGQYVVYRYQRYTDVRMVFAPEFAAAFFGGDPDNFNFPRYDIDAAFLRLYDKGQVVKTPTFLKWNASAPKAGEPTFVSGNPGSTERLLTVSQLETYRDLTIPAAQLQRSELRGRLIEYGRRDGEAKRLVADPIFSLENSYKVFFGRQFTLNDAAFLDMKRREEAELRAKVAADPKLAAEIGDPWGEIDAAQKAYADSFLAYRQLESDAGRGSQLFAWARTLVRAAAERPKASGERLSEFADSRLAGVERGLTTAKKVELPLEQINLEHWLLKSREYLAADPEAQAAVLGRESPEGLAARLVKSKLADPAVRKALWDGGAEAIKASDDPMIQFVLKLDPAARGVRTVWEAKVSGPTDRAAERIAKARFAAYGDSVYPDATFTLRLSYGKVAGWTHRGRTVEPFTTLGGAFERATGEEPYALPKSWLDAKAGLKLDTVYDFVTTNDIIGGNSGSPVVNAKGEVIGAAFDGNIHSLGGAYGYDGAINRTVVVSTAGVTEALKTIYRRDALVKELTGK
ncbi:S46 family peptidase [Caulobacter mirabilis]|nr:S46 family peptidase [Caulobacter mirabilis]